MVIPYFEQFKFTQNISLAKSKLISVLKTKQHTQQKPSTNLHFCH